MQISIVDKNYFNESLKSQKLNADNVILTKIPNPQIKVAKVQNPKYFHKEGLKFRIFQTDIENALN